MAWYFCHSAVDRCNWSIKEWSTVSRKMKRKLWLSTLQGRGSLLLLQAWIKHLSQTLPKKISSRFVFFGIVYTCHELLQPRLGRQHWFHMLWSHLTEWVAKSMNVNTLSPPRHITFLWPRPPEFLTTPTKLLPASLFDEFRNSVQWGIVHWFPSWTMPLPALRYVQFNYGCLWWTKAAEINARQETCKPWMYHTLRYIDVRVSIQQMSCNWDDSLPRLGCISPVAASIAHVQVPSNWRLLGVYAINNFKSTANALHLTHSHGWVQYLTNRTLLQNKIAWKFCKFYKSQKLQNLIVHQNL